MIFGIFFSFNLTKVLASDSEANLGKIVDEGGKSYDVWFETIDFGLKFEPKRPDANQECTYNYADLFTSDSPRSFKSLPTNLDEQAAKNIVWGGLAVFIPECSAAGILGFWHTTKYGVGFHNGDPFASVKVKKKADGYFKITFQDAATSDLCDGVNCEDYRNKENTFKWIRSTSTVAPSHGIFHTKKNNEPNDFYNCHEALKQADTSLNDSNAKDICKKFICRNNDLKAAVRLMKTVYTGTLDRSTDVNDSDCALLGLDEIERPLPGGSRTDGCEFYNESDSRFESDCRFDIKESTPGDTCKDSNVIKTKPGYKYFCNRINKVVKCEVSSFDPTNYDVVFENDMTTLKTGDPQSKCYIPAEMGPADCTSATSCDLNYVSDRDPNKCCYGTSSSNCKSANKTLPSKSDATKDLFCSSDNKVVNCGKSPAGNPLAYHDYTIPCSPSDECRAFKLPDLLSTNITPKCSLIVSPPVAPPAVASACKINFSSSDCDYGDSATANNCWDRNTFKYITLDAGGKYKLFCQKNNTDGKVIICPESFTDYSKVFVGSTKTTIAPAFNSQCKEYYPGISEREARAASCTLNEKNFIYLDKKLGDAQPAEDITPDIPQKQQQFTTCVKGGRTTEECFTWVFGRGISNKNFFRCECSTSYNPSYNHIGCALQGLGAGLVFDCNEKCIMRPTSFANYQQPNKQESFNPITLIKTLSDFLFSLAVIIFIINMLRASFMYVTSSGDEGKMKEAYTTITNTIFGFVFIVFIGALIQYFIALATKVVGS